MKERQINSTNYPLPIFMKSGAVPQTGKTVAASISKNGAAFAAAAGTMNEVGNGFYKLAGNAIDRNTLGSLVVSATAAGCDAFLEQYEIVTHDPFSTLAAIATELPVGSRVHATGSIVSHSGASLYVSGIVSEVPNNFRDYTLIIGTPADQLDYTAIRINGNSDSSGINANNVRLDLERDLSTIMALDGQPVIVLADLVGGGNVNIGDTAVTSNTSGPNGSVTTDYFKVEQTASGPPVSNAQVIAYLTSDYTTNPATAIARGFALSIDDGTWSGMMLNAGLNYTIIARGPDGRTYGPKTLQL